MIEEFVYFFRVDKENKLYEFEKCKDIGPYKLLKKIADLDTKEKTIIGQIEDGKEKYYEVNSVGSRQEVNVSDGYLGFPASVCREVLDKNWNIMIELLKSNGNSIEYDEFFSETEKRLKKYLRKFGKIDGSLDNFTRPPYWDMTKQDIITCDSSKKQGGSTKISLHEESKPNYVDDYIGYINSALQRVVVK